jgi:hypothetical protein
MTSPMDDRASVVRQLEELTEAAGEAAALGQWALVEARYAAREKLLPHASLLPQEAEHMRHIDQDIQERIRVVQAAITSVMQESGRTLQRLNGLRHGLGAASSSDSGMILLKA